VEVSVILLDTNAYSAHFKGDSRITELWESADRVMIPFIVIGELLAGFKSGNSEKVNRELLQSILASFGTEILYADIATAECYAQIAHELKAKGKPIPTNDIWIAAFARQYALPLCTLDAHFAFVEGLAIVPTV
jgi:tRNA(fMet)-specific endonuclease VapC